MILANPINVLIFFVWWLRNTFFNTVGEIKGGKVSGFHNWIQFYLLEKRGQLNYYSHSFNGPVSIHNTDFNMKIYTLPCGAISICPSISLSFFHLFSVDFLPWCIGDAVYVGGILQAGRFCNHWLQPWIWLCLIQPLLHHSPWKTVSISTCLETFSWLWIFFDLDLLLCPIHRCRLSLGGKELIIQTYTWNNSSYGNGKKFIGSAFPATPWT